MPKKVTTRHDKIHADLYGKVNECTSACRALKTEITTFKKAMSNEVSRYVDLIHKQQDRQFKVAGGLILILIFCIGIIGYGAIGARGMYTVRDTFPGHGHSNIGDHPFIPTNDKSGFTVKDVDKDKRGD